MEIHEKLGSWYEKEKRDLPWRNSLDPYKIWLSEVILQQTRVAQGIGYYQRILKKFPDIFSLARAESDDVLKIWQGLGYYSRARNLHETARYIAFQRNGRFPVLYSELLKLKGVGEYTAAAVSSIISNEPRAAVDGNVKRVLSRLFSVGDEINSSAGKKTINSLALQILDPKNPGQHNQAIMELGAKICLPKKPSCIICPLNDVCLALKDNIVAELPVKYKKPGVTNRYFTYLIIRIRNTIRLQKRTGGDIWEGLYEFPLIETPELKELNKLPLLVADFLKTTIDSIQINRISETFTHKLSHRLITCRFLTISVSGDLNSSSIPGKVVNIKDFALFPVPKLIERYISSAGF